MNIVLNAGRTAHSARYALLIANGKSHDLIDFWEKLKNTVTKSRIQEQFVFNNFGSNVIQSSRMENDFNVVVDKFQLK